MTGWPMRMRHVVIVTYRSFSSESEEKSVQWVLSLVNDELAVGFETCGVENRLDNEMTVMPMVVWQRRIKSVTMMW
ncbi:hypothetical protein ACFX15_020259 [Malus domestica]